MSFPAVCNAGVQHARNYGNARHYPISTASAAQFGDPNSPTLCVICQDDLKTSEGCVEELSCRHAYHTACLDRMAADVESNPIPRPFPASLTREGFETHDGEDETAYAGRFAVPTGVPCPQCRGVFVHVHEHRRFVTYSVEEMLELVANGAVVMFERRYDMIKNQSWLEDPVYGAFLQSAQANPTFQVPKHRRDGDLILRGVSHTRPGAFRVRRPDRRFKIVLLDARQMYDYLCVLYHRGWEPSTGQIQPRIDTVKFHRKQLYEVLLGAIEKRARTISQLDFHALYPVCRFIPKDEVPHIFIRYPEDRGAVGGVITIHASYGAWPENLDEDVMSSSHQDRTAALLERLGGVYAKSSSPSPQSANNTRPFVWQRAEVNSRADAIYQEHMLLYERFPAAISDGAEMTGEFDMVGWKRQR